MIKALVDINVILDNYDSIRREKYPESVKLFEMAINYSKKGIFFISVSSLDNIAFIKYKDLKDNYPNLTFKQRNKIVNSLINEILSIFNICKTPSYIERLDEDIDIEDILLINSAKSLGLKFITRDSEILKSYPDIAITPSDYIKLVSLNNNNEIPILDIKAQTLYLYSDIEKEMDDVISKAEFILGSKVKELESKIADYTGTKHCIGVASGTDALLLSLRALAIKKKKQEYWSKEDLVITTPFTFTATGDTILRSGATPLFVDINIDTYNIDVSKVKEAINKYGKRIVGIVPVHLYGLPCDMDEIMNLARENNIFVVEDCAQAFGSMYKSKKVGSFGDAGAFSFFPTKNLGAFGDAGAIVTNDDELAELIRMLRVHGGKDKYNVEHIGYKARIDTLQAGILLAKLKYIDDFNQKRREIAKIYMENLRDLNSIKLPHIPSQDYYHTFHQFTILIKDIDRNLVQKMLKEKGIQTMVYYPVPLHKMKVFEGRCEIFDSLENAEYVSDRVISLPMELLMKIEKVIFISDLIKKTVYF